jgi:hypothetical protein
MARPRKAGLDYFPKDVDTWDDFKIMDLVNEYGPLGYCIYDIVRDEIYKNGYYLEVSLDNLARLIVRKIGNRWIKDKGLVRQVIQYCADIGLFDNALLTQSVITSAGIQRRYSEVTVRNKVNTDKYSLLEKNKSQAVLESAAKTEINVTKNPISVTKKPVSATFIPQKESKLNESKLNKTTTAKAGMQSVSADAERSGSCTAQSIIDIFHSICVSYPKVRSISDARKKAIQARLRVHGADIIREVFEKAESSDFLRGKNDRNWSADFDWIMADRNFAKILDGKYDNRGGNNAKSERTDTHTDELKGIRYL